MKLYEMTLLLNRHCTYRVAVNREISVRRSDWKTVPL